MAGLVPSFASCAMASTPSCAIFTGYCWAVAPMTPSFTFFTPAQPPSTETRITSFSLPAAWSAWYAPNAAGSLIV